ncbi:MAG: hypothetical protein SCALA701_25670 [Candidatus Scalindua sp.]|nr:MAG: hypothetical protein SCALA701_25670 [Candidatus Scalindua sp.]
MGGRAEKSVGSCVRKGPIYTRINKRKRAFKATKKHATQENKEVGKIEHNWNKSGTQI